MNERYEKVAGDNDDADSRLCQRHLLIALTIRSVNQRCSVASIRPESWTLTFILRDVPEGMTR